MTMTEVLQVTFNRHPLSEQHVRDTKNAQDFPADELHEVVVDPGEITVEGTPAGMRWFYDFMDHLVRAWRLEGEQWDADHAEDMADRVWEQFGDRLPDQQRAKKVL